MYECFGMGDAANPLTGFMPDDPFSGSSAGVDAPTFASSQPSILPDGSYAYPSYSAAQQAAMISAGSGKPAPTSLFGSTQVIIIGVVAVVALFAVMGGRRR